MTRARDLADGIFEQATGGVLKLETSDTTVTNGSVLGKIEFKAPDEASGTDAILVGAAIEAVAEGTFAADNNATELVFKTGASAAADTKMVITSGGNLLLGATAYEGSSDSNASSAFLGYNGFISANVTDDFGLQVNRTGTDGALFNLRKNGADVGSIGVISGNPFIGQGDTTIAFSASADCINPKGTNGATRDNAVALGQSSNRFDDAFITNGVTTGSDRTEKQDIAALTSTEMLVAARISKTFHTYRWKDAVVAKGDDARIHTGTIAQEVQAAFTAESLDAGNYAMFMSGTWWEHDVDVAAVEADDTVEPAIEAKDAYTRTDTYDTEDEAPSGSTSRTRLGIRYPELLSFLAAYNEQRFAAIETRLTALEG